MNYVNLKVKFLNPFFDQFLSYVWIKMSKTLSSKYYLENRERLQKKLRKDIKIFLKKNKKKKVNMVVSITKISLRMKNKSLLSTKKYITEWEKTPYYKR